MSRAPEVALFYSARALGLFIKPLSLWAFVRVHAVEESAFLATYYFIVGATFIALNAEAHIPFYKSVFGERKVPLIFLGLAYRTYLRDLTSHILVFLPILFVFFVFYFTRLDVAIAFSVFVLLEKLWDEVQRNLIFSRRYLQWSIWFMAKMAAPVIAVGIHFALGLNLLICMLGCLAFVAVGVAHYLIPRNVVRVGLLAASEALRLRFGLYYSLYRGRFLLGQLVALSSVNLVNVDKWIAPIFASKAILIELVLLSQFGTAYLVLIDNIFFSRSRDHYVKVKARLAQLTNWNLLLAISGIYMTAVVLSAGWFRQPLGIESITAYQAVLAVSAYLTIGISKPLVEHAFWHVRRSLSAALDCCTLAIMVVLAYLCASRGELTLMFIAIEGLLLVRLVGYWLICRGTLPAASDAAG